MLRKFTEESPITRCFASKRCPLIKISSGDMDYAQSEKEKKAMLQERKD